MYSFQKGKVKLSFFFFFIYFCLWTRGFCMWLLHAEVSIPNVSLILANSKCEFFQIFTKLSILLTEKLAYNN